MIDLWAFLLGHKKSSFCFLIPWPHNFLLLIKYYNSFFISWVICINFVILIGHRLLYLIYIDIIHKFSLEIGKKKSINLFDLNVVNM